VLGYVAAATLDEDRTAVIARRGRRAPKRFSDGSQGLGALELVVTFREAVQLLRRRLLDVVEVRYGRVQEFANGILRTANAASLE